MHSGIALYTRTHIYNAALEDSIILLPIFHKRLHVQKLIWCLECCLSRELTRFWNGVQESGREAGKVKDCNRKLLANLLMALGQKSQTLRNSSQRVGKERRRERKTERIACGKRARPGKDPKRPKKKQLNTAYANQTILNATLLLLQCWQTIKKFEDL